MAQHRRNRGLTEELPYTKGLKENLGGIKYLYASLDRHSDVLSWGKALFFLNQVIYNLFIIR